VTSAALLTRVARLIAGRTEEIAETVTAENGTPLHQAHDEVAAAVAAFQFAASETDQWAAHPFGDAVVRRRSRGPVLLRAEAGCPVSVLATRLAAALAVGAPVVIAPSVTTPMTALSLGEILAETDLPVGMYSVTPGAPADAVLPVVTMASPPQGAAVVCPDADLPVAVSRLVTFAARRVIVHSAVAARFVPLLIDAVRSLRTGDPHDPTVDVGPLLDEAAAERVVGWIAAAGEVLTGGTSTGARVAPTVVRSGRGDVAGPVLALSVVDSLDAAFAAAGGDRAGVFTRDLATAVAAPEIDVAELVIGDLPACVSRASVRAAMREFTREQVTEIKMG
jgi:acyl-CoA reductase-like NAD-dependent aldehyde dehydrogenase